MDLHANKLTFFTDLTLNNTRFRDEEWHLPRSAPYTSLFTDTMQMMMFEQKQEAERAEAVFPERLNAGKSLPPNGGLGLNFSPHRIPEVLTGAVVSSSI